MSKRSKSPKQVHYQTCNLCEAMCGIEIHHDGEQIHAIRGDAADDFSRGHICPKAIALQDLHTDPDRLKQPLKRTADGWQEISWEDALQEAADGLRRVQEQYGRDSVGSYFGNPTVHNFGAMLFGPPLQRALGTRNKYSATSVDQLPHHVAAQQMFGHPLLLPIPDLDRTDYMLVIGANPVASNGSLMTAPDVRKRLQAVRKRGGKLVVIDPRRTETASIADQHHAILPGTDALLLAALVQQIFRNNAEQPGRLEAFTDGLDQLRELVAPFTPQRVAGVTGIPVKAIREMAEEFAQAESAVAYARFGASTQQFGGLCQWLTVALNLITGNLDREGGAMFTLPAADLVGMSAKQTRARAAAGKPHRRLKSRVRELPGFAGELPVAALAEEILTPGEGQIRAMLVHAGNPVLSTPNGRQLDRALASLDFMVAIDFYRNETTRHANIILPPTGPLEHANYDLIFHLLAIRNTAKYSPPLFEPEADARHDWEIMLALTTLLRRGINIEKLPARRLVRRGMRRLNLPERLIDGMLRAGPYGLRRPLGPRLSLPKLRDKHPHGIDLGPLSPCLPQRLCTPDRRIRLVPDEHAADMHRLQARLDTDPGQQEFDLLLIGRRHLRSNNSWMHNSHRLIKGPERCTAMIHPQDAKKHGVQDGVKVRIASRVGQIEIVAELSDALRPGVISIPHGWGHDREGTALSVASTRAGASINDLTDDSEVDPLTGTSVLSGVPVRIENAAQPSLF